MDDDIGRYYDRKREQARQLGDELARLRAADPRDEDAIRRCRERLERARYVGD